MFILAFALWIGFSIAIGIRAGTRGRNGGGWFFFALLLSPLVAGIFLFVLPPLQPRQLPTAARRDPRWQALRSTPMPVAETMEAQFARRRRQDMQALFGSLAAVAAILGLFLFAYLAA
jgi:hypothetical protein